MGNCRTNAGTATPSSCSSGVTVPAWGVPERFEYGGSIHTADVDVVKFSEWQLAVSDSLFRFEYVHKDEDDDGMGPSYMQVELFFADDDAGTGSTLIAKEQRFVPYSETERYFSTVVEMIVPAGTYFKALIFQPLLLSPAQGPLPDGVSAYTWSNATLVAMENQS